ncbi:MAG: YbaK/prolyl-tRNA synthetase associated domain-containing protein [Candidatus Aenigmarchaeota archaeon]|nr:YbaK/prolyl-tRNA synthetase associated domain-containing protein [Candidatus Aenigmarchaeota archaeon]
MPAESIYQSILDLLNKRGVAYREIEHEAAGKSKEVAIVRGDDEVGMGGKALVVKVGEDFKLFVLSSVLKFDSSAVMKYFHVKKCRFATHDEVKALTTLVVGTIPPFGRPILPLDVYADPSIIGKKNIGFNAASLTHSIVMSTADWLKVANPVVFKFARDDLESYSSLR